MPFDREDAKWAGSVFGLGTRAIQAALRSVRVTADFKDLLIDAGLDVPRKIFYVRQRSAGALCIRELRSRCRRLQRATKARVRVGQLGPSTRFPVRPSHIVFSLAYNRKVYFS
jgi:hypothetical protein